MSWREGDLHPQTRLERKFSRWSLYSRLPQTQPLEAHVADVLSQMDSNSTAFIEVVKDFGGWIQLVGYFFEQYPGLHFDSSLVRGLARYGIGVDFDFYYMWSDAREDT